MSSQSSGEIFLREMTAEDLAGADALRRLAGWNQTAADWRRLLSLGPQGCFVALREGRVVGSVTTTIYGMALAWIGMMLVRPEERGRGIGRRLMESALGHLERAGVRSVKLDATPQGRPLYEKFGFVEEGTLQRCLREAGAGTGEAGVGAPKTRRMTEKDWAQVEKIDERAFGASRLALLRDLAEGAKSVRVWPADGPAGGYGMLRPGDRAEYIGPGVCASPEGAGALVSELLKQVGARPVFWDVLDRNKSAGETARRFGFLPARPLTRMRRGPEAAPGNLAAQFALADPAVG